MRNTVIRNSSIQIEGQVFLDEDKSIVADLNGGTILAMFKDNPKRPDSASLITKNLDNGIVLTNEAEAMFLITINADELDINNSVIYFETVATLLDGTKIRSGSNPIYIRENVVHD